MRRFITQFIIVFLGVYGTVYADQASSSKEVLVYRSPTCGCCGKWVNHLKDNGFTVKDVVTDEVSVIKEKYGVPNELVSCHTAIVDGYVIEGHVPASDIKVMLNSKPQISGISVPGMPRGTPGMEMGELKDAYKVIAFDKQNRQQVFNNYDDGD
ncbi:MAG: DUF411 domain-containing protein [Gammaproteobacteria bacterium]